MTVSLVRSFVVVLVDEAVKTSLLAFERGLWRACGLSLECTVHAFVSAILFGMSRDDAFD